MTDNNSPIPVNNNNNPTTNTTATTTTPTTTRKFLIKISTTDEEQLARRGYKIGKSLNAGSFARVYLATRHGQPCAVKVIDLSKTSDDYKLKFLPRELYTMKKLTHPYLITIYDIFALANRTMVMIFMELAEGGDLLDILREVNVLAEAKARMYYCQFGDAVKYMHSLDFAHRDIKCENVLLNQTRTVAKLTDFGFARTCFDTRSCTRLLSDTYCGSAAYAAPEVLRTQPYSPLKADVWSVGVLLFVLLNGKLPFSDADNQKLLRRQLERKYNFYNKTLSSEARDIINQHLIPNPAHRPTMVEMFTHVWLTI